MAEAPATCPFCGAAAVPGGMTCPNCATHAASLDETLPNPGSESIPNRLPERVGEFRIDGLIGRGGMGSVYLAWQDSMHRHVALKVMDAAALSAESSATRFEREAWIAGRLNHPHVVKVHGQGAAGTVRWIAMERVDGESLHAELARERKSRSDPRPGDSGRRSAERIRRLVSLFADVADALEHVHTQGIVHRDVKPLNLLVTRDGARMLLTDFGLARDREASRMTRRGDLLGTIRYMSPEQLLAHRGTIDHRSDLWSFGVSLYEAITLDFPYDGASEEAYISAVGAKDPVPARARDRSIPRDLDTILRKCLERDPERRYPSAAALRDDLRRVLESRPVLAKPPSRFRRMTAAARRHRVPIAAALGTAALLAGSILVTRIMTPIGGSLPTVLPDSVPHLEGSIVGPDGAPRPRFRVVLRDTASGRELVSEASDEQGRYVLAVEAGRRYELAGAEEESGARHLAQHLPPFVAQGGRKSLFVMIGPEMPGSSRTGSIGLAASSPAGETARQAESPPPQPKIDSAPQPSKERVPAPARAKRPSKVAAESIAFPTKLDLTIKVESMNGGGGPRDVHVELEFVPVDANWRVTKPVYFDINVFRIDRDDFGRFKTPTWRESRTAIYDPGQPNRPVRAEFELEPLQEYQLTVDWLDRDGSRMTTGSYLFSGPDMSSLQSERRAEFGAGAPAKLKAPMAWTPKGRGWSNFLIFVRSYTGRSEVILSFNEVPDRMNE